MNKISGHISAIEVSGSMSLITIDIMNILQLKSIIIETPDTASYLVIGNEVQVIFKETEVVIGTGDTQNISLQNKIPGQILTIESGKIISKITLRSDIGDVGSIISTNAVKSLDLKVGMQVVAMIKVNEIMLSS